jgi:FtsZ-binding cell division protein ZapB
MSDTPRTDAEAFYPHDSNEKVCDAVFARQLEGELNAANAEVERLTLKVAELYDGAEEQKQRIQSLIEERDRANRLAEWKWNLRGEFESLLGTSDITTGIGIVKTLIQGAKDNVELMQQVKEQKKQIKKLDKENDAMRADLLLWQEQEMKP